VKLSAHRAGLPGNEISFPIVPLDPAYKAGLAGHLPAKKCDKYLKRVVIRKGFKSQNPGLEGAYLILSTSL